MEIATQSILIMRLVTRYTTDWTRENLKTQEEWVKWLSSLRNDDKCVVQEFIKKAVSAWMVKLSAVLGQVLAGHTRNAAML